MSRTELKRYKAMLEAKQVELSAGLPGREEIAIENAADTFDQIQLAGERELALRNLHRESALLRSIRSALARLNDGRYGFCLHCEGEIKEKRLEAVPWAAYCIRCQEAADRDQLETAPTEGLTELVFPAA